MYTSLTHPETGKEIQFKTGHDTCEWLELGQEVPWEIFASYPGEGHLLDYVYDGYHGGSDDEDVWVIIKNHRLVHVASQFAPYDAWIDFFEIKPPPDEWWSDEVWEANRDNGNQFAGTPAEVLKDLMNRPSFAQQILPIQEVDIGQEND